MRPKIPDQLVERIENCYEDAGYATESEFIRDAIRRRLEDIENETAAVTPERTFEFDSAVYSESQEIKNDEYPPLYVLPEGGRVSNVADSGSKLVLRIDSKTIEESEITERMTEVDVVGSVGLTRRDPWERETYDDGWIKIRLADEQVQKGDLDSAIERIFESLQEAIIHASSWDNPHKELEDVVNRYTR